MSSKPHESLADKAEGTEPVQERVVPELNSTDSSVDIHPAGAKFWWIAIACLLTRFFPVRPCCCQKTKYLA